MLLVLLPPEDSRPVAKAFIRAAELAGLKHDWLAAAMLMPHQQLADQLAGRGHLSVQRMRKLWDDRDGRRFLQFFLCELIHPSSVNRVLARHTARMLRAELRPPVNNKGVA